MEVVYVNGLIGSLKSCQVLFTCILSNVLHKKTCFLTLCVCSYVRVVESWKVRLISCMQNDLTYSIVIIGVCVIS